MDVESFTKKKIKSTEKLRLFDDFLERVRSGRLNHRPRKILVEWMKENIGVSMSERHFRRLVNKTPN